MDLIPLLLTFFVTLGLGLEFGIGIGLISSVIFLLYYTARPRVQVLQGEVSNNLSITITIHERKILDPKLINLLFHRLGQEINSVS
jgi:MFS superfamily sulfate permease-like transporter